MNEDLKKRILALEKRLMPEVCMCLVELPDGTQKETTIDDWFENRKEWEFKKMTVASDPAAVLLVLADVDDQVAEWALSKGDIEGATKMTAEAAQYVAEYERRTHHEKP